MATRSETVVVTMVDNLSSVAARQAAQVALLDRSLERLEKSSSKAGSSNERMSSQVSKSTSAFRKGGSDIDMFSGRLRLMAEAAAVLGPALIPLGGAAVPVITGLASGLGAAAGAAGVAALAFKGVGSSLQALNDYQLDPSSANLAKLTDEFERLGPSGEHFVRYIDSISGELEQLQRIAGAGMFPGMERGIDSLMTLLPQVSTIVSRIATEMGDLSATAGKALSTDADWGRFFTYLKTDAAPTLDAFARAAGNVGASFANLMVAFAPLSRDFTTSMLEGSQALREWTADGDNLTGFIDYIQSVGPQAADFLGSLVDAVVALTTALAPWGAAVLPVMTGVLDLFTAIAGSPIGPALTTAALAMLAFNRAASAGTAIMGRVAPAFGGVRSSVGQMRTDLGTVATTWATAGAATERESKKMAAATGRLKGNMAAIGKGAALVGAVGVAASGAANGIGLQNTAMLGLTGTMAGPWGAAAGAAVGLVLDFQAAQDQAAASASELAGLLDAQTGAMTRNYAASVAAKMKPEDLSVLREAGVNVGDMTSALLEGGDAWSRFRAEMDASGLKESDWSLFGLGSSGGDVGEAIKNMDNLSVLVGASKDAFREQKPAVDAAADSVANAARATAELTAAQRAQNQATLASIDAGTRWGDAIANAAKQAHSGTRGFNLLTEAGRANRNAMSQLVGAYNAQGDAVKNSTKGYGAARDRIAEFGHQMGLTRERIQQLQGALDKPLRPKVDGRQANQTFDQIRERIGRHNGTKVPVKLIKANPQNALQGIGSVASGLAGLHDKTITINTVHQQTFSEIHERIGMAGGGTVPGQREPYGDKILIHAAPGEEIISNRHGQADAFRRDRASGRIPAYAEGGTIGLPSYATGGTVKGKKYSGPEQHTAKGWAHLSKMWERSTHGTERALKAHGKQLDKATARLDYWNNKRNEAKSQVTSALTLDWFNGGSENAFSSKAASGTAAFAQQQWKQQATNSETLAATIANLRKNGAGDAFIAEILGSPDPLAAAQMFNKQTKAGMHHSQKLFLDATRATRSAANSTTGIYSDEIRGARRDVQGVRHDIRSLTALEKRQHKQAEATRKKASAAKAASKGARDKR